MSYNFEQIQGKIKCSLNKLIEFDSFLFEKDLNERTITHKLAEYLQQEFKDWNVDCEYNRDFEKYIKSIPKWNDECYKKPKINDSSAKTVFPDIIVHQRESRDNLIVIEAKKSATKKDRKCDINKLEMFIKKFDYKFGFFIDFAVVDKCGYEVYEVVTEETFKGGNYD